jgi:imidazolonepropionase-like amidohydrolase
VSPDEAADAAPATIEHTETLFEGTFAAAHAGQDLAAEIARWRTSEASALFAKFVRHGTAVDPTLIAQEHLIRLLERGTPDDRERYMAASARREAEKSLTEVRRTADAFVRTRKPVLAEMRAVTGMMHRAGVTLVTGSDTSFIHPPGFIVHDELELFVAAGLTPADALRAATVNPASMFPSQNTGTVAAGKRADLMLLDANPLDDIRHTRRIRAVVVRGRYFDRQALDRLLLRAVQIAAGS